MTQRNIILAFLKAEKRWVPGYALEKVATPWGWIGSSGMRRCRELENDGLIESRRNGKYVEYRIREAEPIKVEMFEPKYRPEPQQSLL